jgi:hypothetical protein
MSILNFANLLKALHEAITEIDDPRQSSNATKYKVKDAVLGAFSVFFMQCESFLEHQRQMQSRKGRDNAQRIFGLDKIPTNNQIRNILDGIKASSLFVVFWWVYKTLKVGGFLEAYRRLDNLLIVLDGTEYFSSKQISCEHCSSRSHKNGNVTNFHSVILPVIVAPGLKHVIGLSPEFIIPQDGSEKQDCEQNAAKRWIASHGSQFNDDSVTLLGDDLYSRQPLCELCLQHKFNFIFVCKPESHKSLYAWLKFLDASGNVYVYEQRRWCGRVQEIYTYRYANNIPLREAEPSQMLNWCELTITNAADSSTIYHNSFITNHSIFTQNISDIVDAGRARWKVENESHNVLKTKGYHLEHNFGHGNQNLSAFLLTLNFLAFLFHSVLHLADEAYQQVRKLRGTRKGFFGDILTLTSYFLFDSWQHLISFMLPNSEVTVNTS